MTMTHRVVKKDYYRKRHNKLLQQTWLLSRFLLTQECLLMPRYRSAAKQLNRTLGFFLLCPPVTRGQEVSENATASEKCKNYEAKEYLLHSQNAIIEFLVRDVCH
jgi:ornithine carbamoyltransferase